MNRPDGTATKPARSREARILLAVTVTGSMMLAAMAVVTTSQAAFSDTTDNPGNSVTAGSVTLTDDDGTVAMYNNLTDVVPGTIDGGPKCINVSYSGSLAAAVRLYGTVSTTGTAGSVAPYVNVNIEIGTTGAKATAFDCTNFTPSSTLLTANVLTGGAGVDAAGTLSKFGTVNNSFANGLTGWETAATGQSRSYRISLSLQDNDAAQGKNAQVTFTWEAQNT